ncbi:MAG: cob(I)yrinic acid a,c-diamide adenosyltransferase [Actinomycetota bacterium]|nr:cob(I)yrinic acid a,c-diamide adenosyltransferase [Actinomycetota bacterium]
MSVHLTRIYTRLGDDGQTDLADLSRVEKTNPRVEAVGAVDELNAALGLALAAAANLDHHPEWLGQIQNDLFDLGADLTRPTAAGDEAPHLRIDDSYVSWLEHICDDVNANLPALRSFVLPGGTPAAAHLHMCRTICRRAERRVLGVPGANPVIIRYLNRLSDLLFILSRGANNGHHETLWRPGRSNRDGEADVDL